MVGVYVGMSVHLSSWFAFAILKYPRIRNLAFFAASRFVDSCSLVCLKLLKYFGFPYVLRSRAFHFPTADLVCDPWLPSSVIVLVLRV